MATRGSDRDVDKLLAAAERAKAKGEAALGSYLIAEAAHELTAGGRVTEAIDLYTMAREYAPAAELAQKNGDHEQAARLWFRAGNLAKSAEARLMIGEDVLAAELMQEAGEFARAAEIFEARRDFVRAGDLYERAGEKVRAAELFARVITGEGTVAPGGAEAQEICRRAGVLFAQVGRLADAVQILRYGNQLVFAGKLLVQQERYDEAIELLRAAGELVLAAEACRKAGQERRGSLLLAQRDEDEGRIQVAAARYEQAGAFADAARCYELSNDFFRAAIVYENAGEMATAGSLFERLGCLEEAKRCYRAAGMNTELEALEERTSGDVVPIVGEVVPGELLRAASRVVALARSGELSRYYEGVELLEKVRPADAEYTRARTLLAEVYEEQGDMRKAWETLRELLHGLETPTAEHVPAYYQYGRALEREGFLAEARQAFRTAAALDPSYKDVKTRAQLAGTTRSGARNALQARELPPRSKSGSDLSWPPPRTPPAIATISQPALRPQQEAKTTIAALMGTTLRGRFRLERVIGSGGQAVVCLARDMVTNRPVAIKILNSIIEEDGESLERFLREVRLAARVHHPNCIGVYDFGRERGLTFMAMEYFEGVTLAAMLKNGPVEPAKALSIALQVAQALEAVHGEGVIHRDIKPANIMIDESGDVRLTDFGIAKHVSEDTNTGLMIGTLAYMAPEQASGKDVDARTDVFSLGVVMFEMFAGVKPWGSNLESLAQRAFKPPPPLPEDLILPDIVQEAVTRCLQPKPEARYPELGPLIADLEVALDMIDTGDDDEDDET